MTTSALVPLGASPTRIDEVCVVIPARNEAGSLSRCLRALLFSGARIDAALRVVVVLDSCTDASPREAARLVDEVGDRLTLVTTESGSAGAARQAGVAALLNSRSTAPDRTWLASTDADSVVPPHWLPRHLAHARAGALVVAGTIEVDDWSSWSGEVRRRYERGYARRRRSEGHGHVHGANLGVRADIYQRLGGFDPTAVNEDVDLIRRADHDGVPVAWALDIAVRTSARAIGRAQDGFAGHLRALADDAAPLTTDPSQPTRSAT